MSQDQLQGELKEPLLGGKKRFVTVRVDAEMAKELDAHKVQYAGRFESDLVPMILSWVLPTLIFFGIWMLISRRMARQLGGWAAASCPSASPRPRSTSRPTPR